MANSELMVIYHLVMTNIAMENAKIKDWMISGGTSKT